MGNNKTVIGNEHFPYFPKLSGKQHFHHTELRSDSGNNPALVGDIGLQANSFAWPILDRRDKWREHQKKTRPIDQ
jgi:hypothetical protein